MLPLHGGGGGRPAGTPAGLPAGLPFPTVFALREGTAFRGLAGCPPVDTAAGIYGLFYQLLPACWGRGLGLAAAAEALRRLERLAPALVLADTVAENTASVRILERLGFVRTAVHHRAFCRGGGCWISGTTPAAGLVRRRPSDRDGPVQHEEMRNVHEQKTAAVRL
ncbi:MAG: GNAT family N-acetyltransferase [Dysosmobacter welbionis]